ncbi:MAG: AmmeMemoRadiSam system protein B [Ignavibacteriales bacterium]|nr:AmmeMemoRadiSam system protein B [Ignavibacteriales bacterium]
MKNLRIILVLILILVSFSNCKSQENKEDRKPVYAGQFYPADELELEKTLKELFDKVGSGQTDKPVLAIISPHAGYIYSGMVAATSFNQIDGNRDYKNIFILASSHRLVFEGASIYSYGDFITPLGNVKVNTELADSLIESYDVFSNRKDAHLLEHSIEVQLPFLQYVMEKDFQIVPIVIGAQTVETCEEIAEALEPYFNENNLFIISTDFSHYPNYEDAKLVDSLTAFGICSNSSEVIINTLINNEKKNIPNLATSLCGWSSVLTLILITEEKDNLEYQKLLYQNSGDSKIGDKSKVVGYYSIVVTKNNLEEEMGFQLNDDDKKELLKIARNTIEVYLDNGKIPEVEVAKLPENLTTKCGAFVTLHKDGDLRGCIGRFDASLPLYQVVQNMAIAASTQDPRFLAVTRDELDKCEIEISVLTPMKKIKSIDEIQLGKHGIYIKKGYSTGTFLPQVATETGWTKEEFLGHCARDKAGIGWTGWKDADIYIYEALVFSEADFEE